MESTLEVASMLKRGNPPSAILQAAENLTFLWLFEIHCAYRNQERNLVIASWRSRDRFDIALALLQTLVCAPDSDEHGNYQRTCCFK